MLKNFFHTAWRNLLKNKGYSFINLFGLATGMTVALLIGLWCWDELSFDQYHRNYPRLAQVMVNQTLPAAIETGQSLPIPLAGVLRTQFHDDFKHIALVFPNFSHSLAVGDQKLSASGIWTEPELTEMLTLNMVEGHKDALKDPSSVLITRSLAKALFGKTDPMNRIIRVDNMTDVKVAGIYEDFPQNTSFYGTQLILAWDKAVSAMSWVRDNEPLWDTRYWKLFVELKEGVDIVKLSEKIRNTLQPHVKRGREELWLHPMRKWRLYSEFKNGKIAGGRINLVWLFGLTGGFVLLLACINFMNLSTARSEKRAKEVGIRKAVGSSRGQLIRQFLAESVLNAFLSLVLALGMMLLSMHSFNNLTQKQLFLPFANPLFEILLLGFTGFTGIVAGSYPAFYLSAFNPVKVLKGGFRVGRQASVPRKVLIAGQFSVSVLLVICTLVINRQIQHAVDRPVGYIRAGLITVEMNTQDIFAVSYDHLRDDLIQSGAAIDMAESSSHVTETPYKSTSQDFSWKGQDPKASTLVGFLFVTHDFGSTIGWHIVDGRDFSRSLATDTGALILNEAAVRLTGLKQPIGETIRFDGKFHPVVGVVGDMVMESPYTPIQPTIFQLGYPGMTGLTVRLNPHIPVREALAKTQVVFKKYNPGGVFAYQFADEEYAAKFANEELISRLTMVFTGLAIFISCLGLFGLASFSAEQRTKEIGVRKVVGASVFDIWALLSKDFVRLAILSWLIASPVAGYLMHNWLKNYPYRISLPAWVFGVTGTGVIAITLLTVSYQSIRAARTKPVKSLRTQ